MDEYYKNLETFLQNLTNKLFVYPTQGGRIEWVISSNNILVIENNYIRCGWNSESFLSDQEIKTSLNGYKFVSPRECTVENFIRALKKLDTITLCGMLIVRIVDTIFFFQSYNSYQASVAVREWFKNIFEQTPNITLENIHNLVEQNKGDDQSQILLSRTWLDLLQNCSRECDTDDEILRNIKKQINYENTEI
mgnify:CR=1 FL=1